MLSGTHPCPLPQHLSGMSCLASYRGGQWNWDLWCYPCSSSWVAWWVNSYVSLGTYLWGCGPHLWPSDQWCGVDSQGLRCQPWPCATWSCTAPTHSLKDWTGLGGKGHGWHRWQRWQQVQQWWGWRWGCHTFLGNPEESLHESDNEGRDVNSPSNDPQDQGRGEVNAPRHRSTSSSLTLLARGTGATQKVWRRMKEQQQGWHRWWRCRWWVITAITTNLARVRGPSANDPAGAEP